MARWQSTITLDDFANELRERFSKGVFLLAQVQRTEIPGLMKGATKRYLLHLHDRGDISCAEGVGGYQFNETPIPCGVCASRKEARDAREAEVREMHLLPAEIAQDVKDIQRIREKVKGTRLGDQIEAAMNELKALAEIARRFR